MKSKADNFKTRNRQGDNRYFIDNIFLKTWGAKLGPHCIAVYNVLVMHADADSQTAYPSFQAIADLTGMSRRQVVREIDKLKANNIIRAERRPQTHPETGKPYFLTDIFTLLHPDEWAKVGEVSLCESSDSESLPLETDSHQPSDTQSQPLVTLSHTNKTHLNKTQLTNTSPYGEAPPIEPLPESRPEPERAPPRRGKNPRAPDSPALKVFTEITEYYAITTHWRNEVARIVGEKPEDLEFWRKVVIGWTGKYPSKHNIEGMLDFYKRREIPGYQPSGVIKNGHSYSQPTTKTTEGAQPPGKSGAVSEARAAKLARLTR